MDERLLEKNAQHKEDLSGIIQAELSKLSGRSEGMTMRLSF